MCKRWLIKKIIIIEILFGLLLNNLFATQGPLLPKMEPNAPVVNFLLPMFGPNGYKAWDLRGQKGHYINPEQIEIECLTIKVYSGDAAMSLESVIESPTATVFIRENRACGDQTIVVSGANYSAIGKGWEWDATQRKILLKENVKVVFKEPLTSVIK